MIVKGREGIEVYPHRVKYKKHGEEMEQWALPSKEWWKKTCEKHNHLELQGFEEVELSEEQQERFEKLKQLRIPEGFISICIDYVLDGEFPEEVEHILRSLEFYEEQKQQDQDIADAYYEIMQVSGGGE